MAPPKLDRLADPAFAYVKGSLAAEGVPLARIAAEIGTPFYCYSAAALRRAYRQLANALTHLPATICYGVKANSNPAVIAVLAQEGAGADVVSEGEIRKALAAVRRAPSLPLRSMPASARSTSNPNPSWKR
jgi:diaminopimelate decarboxylase